MAATVPLIGELGLKDDKFNQALARNQQKFRQFSQEAGRGLSGAFSQAGAALTSLGGVASGVFNGIKNAIGGVAQALGISGLLSTAGILAGLKDIADFGGRLSDVSTRTGIAVDDLVILEEQFRQAGLGAGMVTQTIRRMNDALLDSKKQELFKALGLDAASLLRDNPAEALDKIISQIRKVGTTAQQQKALGQIFGNRQGIELMTLVADQQSFAKAKQFVGEMSGLMAKNADDLDRVSDVFGGIPTKIRGAFAGFIDPLLSSLTKAAETLAAADFSGPGKKLGEQLVWAWGIFSGLVQNGEVWEWTRARLKQAFVWSLSYLFGGLSTIFKALFSRENMMVLDNIYQAFNHGLVAAGSAAVAAIGEELAGIMDWMVPFGVHRKIIGDQGAAGRKRDEHLAISRQYLSNAAGLGGDMIPITGKRILEGLGDIKPLEAMAQSLAAADRAVTDLQARAATAGGTTLLSPISNISDLRPTMRPLEQARSGETSIRVDTATLEQILGKIEQNTRVEID